MDSFCNVFLKKRFIKCISNEDNKCYLFVGRIPFIRKITNKIKKNKQLTEFNVKSIRCIPGEKPLTKKELEVFGYLFNGLKLSKIASTLEVSLPTVKFHLKNLYRKLGIKGRREIITICQSAPK